MVRGAVNVKGYLWPESDIHARAVIGDAEDVELALKYVTTKAVAIQAGGLCGVWANRLLKSFAEVWTIEPDLQNYLYLVRNMDHGVMPIWGALTGNGIGGVSLERRENNAGAHFVDGPGRIGTLTIDELQLENVGLICLDIEGMEPLALAGAIETLERCKPVLMVEDKGLSERYGHPRGWPDSLPGYRVVERVKRDVILVAA